MSASKFCMIYVIFGPTGTLRPNVMSLITFLLWQDIVVMFICGV